MEPITTYADGFYAGVESAKEEIDELHQVTESLLMLLKVILDAHAK